MNSNIPLSQVKRGEMSDPIWKNALIKTDGMMGRNIWLDDDPYLTPRILQNQS